MVGTYYVACVVSSNKFNKYLIFRSKNQPLVSDLKSNPRGNNSRVVSILLTKMGSSVHGGQETLPAEENTGGLQLHTSRG